ncbi:hypothetical protein [[Mycobacterium] wendilense]|uniref:Oxidoreductase n=1 Tax=[Mycobacterium] wendilense TaxID=3064284 RepID=A0ABN9P5F0_9MYCO|nr:hypothetical protein [Mycolicibacterium sp. MU0050]CAJ1587519.1 hypothetical protein MU0050_004841 [Mycolicibacterium sp. MU0050]
MSKSTTTARIDDAAPGDIIALDRGAGGQDFKVVHKETVDSGFLITLEGDDGETCQLEMAPGTPVTRSLEAKWESTQSPTMNSEP